MLQELIILILGIFFGWLLSFAGLNKYNTIAGLSVLKDFTVAKTIMLVLGAGAILLTGELIFGLATFHLKPLYLIGTGLGGIIFGIGMSILGYCPGTLPISLGQGALDAFWGIAGGLLGGWVFTVLYPVMSVIRGNNLGELSLFTITGSSYSLVYITVVVMLSIAMILGAFLLHRLDVRNGLRSKRWIVTGLGLALLNCILFYSGWQNRPMGASSSYPYLIDMLTGTTQNAYFSSIQTAGNWQLWFLFGAGIAGFFQSMKAGTFRIRLIQDRWQQYKGGSKIKRVIWAFIGGFLLILGARLAGGCTSGHIISGGMQVAISSYVFAIFTFIGFLSTGYFFYTRHHS